MLFSERYGYKKAEMLKKNEMPDSLRTAIWNVFYKFIFSKIGYPKAQFLSDRYDPLPYRFLDKIYDEFFRQDLQTFDTIPSHQKVKCVHDLHNNLKWYEVYDLIEFVIANMSNKDTLNLIWGGISRVIEEEKTQFRIVNGLIVPLTSDEEIKEIENALNIPNKYKAVRKHLAKALELFSKRPEADYENSIKESISAVDLLVQIILGKEGTLGKLVDGLDIHPALKKAFSNLYGWTSDDAGIRHPKFKEPLSCGEPEARYMLITCSAFINYLTAKHETKQ